MDVRAYVLSKFPDRRENSSGKIHTRCPFHDDKSPSFSIDVDSGLFVCGSPRCGVRGNIYKFYQLMENVTWPEVFRQFKEETRVERDVDKLFTFTKDRVKEFVVNSWPDEHFLADPVRIDYLDTRQIPDEIRGLFQLRKGLGGVWDGVDIQAAIVFPIYDIDGTYRTFQSRQLRPNVGMRWKTPSGSPIHNLLYAGWLVGRGDGDLWIVEGASDCWNMWKLGVQAVGLFTKEASSAQLNRIFGLCQTFGLRPVVCLDGDVAKGNRDFVKKLYGELAAFGLSPEKVQLELSEDPGELTEQRFAEIKEQLS